MKLQLLLLVTCTSAFTFFSCGDSQNKSDEDGYILQADERELCLQQHIDTALVALVRNQTRVKLDVFAPDSIWMWGPDDDVTTRASTLEGIMFEATSDQASTLCDKLRKIFLSKDHTMFVYEQNFGLDNEKDKVAIVNTADKYEILRETGTDGLNYDIDNDSVITIIKSFDAKYDLTLAGCGLDWCLFYIGDETANWDMMAKEIYDVCPDVVDQGTGSVGDLAKELQDFGMLYLWWD